MKQKSKIIALAFAVVLVVAGLVIWNNISGLMGVMDDMGGTGIFHENPEKYELVSLLDGSFTSTAFTPSDDPNSYSLFVEPVLNAETGMMKRAVVASGNGTSWQLLCDEGGTTDYDQQAPNPLSYFIAGSSMNLVNTLTATAIEMNLSVDTIKVEQRITYTQPDLMTPKAAGYTEVITTGIILESDESVDDLKTLKDTAVTSWAVGDGLSDASIIRTELLINDNHFDEYYSTPGIIVSDKASVNEALVMKLMDTTPVFTTIEPAEDTGMSVVEMALKGSVDLDFELVSVAESIGTKDNPYLSKASVRCNMPGYKFWDIYSDDAALYGATSSLPTSLHYFTAGTGLCLTTQTTGAKATLGLDMDNYRVEQQILYTDTTTESVDTYILVESDESQEDLEQFSAISLTMCFAGEALKNPTDMEDSFYVNGNEIVG